MSDRPKTSSADEWALWLDEWKGANTAFLAVQIAEAIEEQRADLLPVVKPLVWEETPSGGWKKGKVVGRIGGEVFATIVRVDHGWFYNGRVYFKSACGLTDALIAAQAAAQADHDARLRACLDMTDPAELVAGAYEAAARQLFEQHPAETASAIRSLTPADAQAALDAAIAKAVNARLDEVAEKLLKEANAFEKMGFPSPAQALKMVAGDILSMKEDE